MPLNPQEQPITNQLSQAIKEMRDFLLNNPYDKEYYKVFYEKIDRLTITAKTEGWDNYKHDNPHKTLADFLNKNNTTDLVLKYYSIPSFWKRDLMKQSKINKSIKGGKKLIEWVFDNISKIKPDIKIF